MSKKSRITDNPTSRKLLEGIKGMEALRSLYEIVPGAKQVFPNLEDAFSQLDAVKDQMEILHLPDRFNEHFASRGWIAYESMNMEVMKEAVSMADAGNHDKAEEYLADYYNEENLKWLTVRFQGVKEFRSRLRLIDLAKIDYLEGRYHACIPLLLALIDGLVNDISKHVGFFAENSDMTAWDSIAAHETGLQAIAGILRKKCTKTNEEPITIPYRNGILHGRELAFDNKIVAAKCWSTLFAVRDWAGSLAEGKKHPKPQEEKPLTEVLRQYGETRKLRRKIDEWKRRTVTPNKAWPSKGPAEMLPEGTPERVTAEFIENWSKGRYGKLAEGLVDFLKTPIKKKAGQVKNDFGHIRPISYEILEVIDEAPAISKIRVSIEYEKKGIAQSKQIIITAVYQDEDSNPLLRDVEQGQWKINQAGFGDIIYDFK